MADIDEDGQRVDPPTASPPPYQALLPGFDRMSRSSFDKGTLSRRRINLALAGLALLAVAIAAVIVWTAVAG